MNAKLRAVALALAALVSVPAAAGGDTAREHQIKAAFLYNFTKFTEWPDSAFAAKGAPLAFGAFCDDSFNGELAAIVKDRKLNAHPLQVRPMIAPADAAAVQVVFVCRDQELQLPAIRRATGGRPVLLVGETPAAQASGAAITFVVVDDKVRFEVDADAAKRAGLRISAQLQKLALGVRRGP